MLVRRLFAGVVVLSLLGCRRDDPKKGAGIDLPSAQEIASAMAYSGQTKVTGSLHSAGGELGTWDTTFDDCQSGDYNGFFGVDLYAPGSKSMRLRYVKDQAAGDIMKVTYPQKLGTARVFDGAEKCTIREGTVEKSSESTRVPGRGYVTHLHGHLKFDCTDGPGRVQGEATFEHCH